MARIVLRFLIVFALIINLIMIILSYIYGVNIYQKYGKQILKVLGVFVLLIVAFYVALALLGLS
ncbi:MAG: hypothetical protein K6A44_07970 [bacterium]|nr:hypothetical protein [bacterium]